MKKRTTVIGTLMSLLSFGQPLLIGTGTVLTSAAVMLSVPERVWAEKADVYLRRGSSKSRRKDYHGAIIEYSKAIDIGGELLPEVYVTRGIAKKNIGDIGGACSDFKEGISLGYSGGFVRHWIRTLCD